MKKLITAMFAAACAAATILLSTPASAQWYVNQTLTYSTGSGVPAYTPNPVYGYSAPYANGVGTAPTPTRSASTTQVSVQSQASGGIGRGNSGAADDIKWEIQLWWSGSGTKWNPFYVPTSGGISGSDTSTDGVASDGCTAFTTTTTQSSGNFNLSLPAGNIQVQASSPYPFVELAYTTSGGSQYTDGSWQATASGTINIGTPHQ